MADYTTIDDLTADGLEHILAQYEDAERIQSLIGAAVGALQPVEDAVAAIVERALSIDEAGGALLDRIGRILVTSRDGLDDDRFRRRLRVRVRVARSHGLAADLYDVIDLWGADEAHLREPAAGHITIDIVGVQDADRLVGWLVRAKSGGVELDGITYAAWAADETFTLAPTSGVMATGDLGQGLGSVYDIGAGGRLAGFFEAGTLPAAQVRAFSSAFSSAFG